MRNQYLALVPLFCWLGACSSPSADCVPGVQEACTCPNGAPSAKVCGADRAFGACLCDTIDGGGLDAGSMDATASDASGSDGSVSDSSTLDSTMTADMSSVDAGPESVLGTYFAGGYHTCHVRPTGDVACWGRNESSEVGASGTTSTSAHVISSLTGVQTMAAGGGYSCAVTELGSVKCWGENTYRELGDGSTTERSAAVTVSGVSNAVQVDVSFLLDTDAVLAGNHHSCATQDDGDVFCWGNNESGQLGDGTTMVRNTAVSVSGLGNIVSVAVGNAHTCALSNTGTVECWGTNAEYERGSSSALLGSSPNTVSLGDTISQLAAGAEFTCALRDDGQIQCWGKSNYGQLGHSYVGAPPDRDTPQSVSGASDSVSICAGAEFACALRATGAVQCWGRNHRGQLGDGTTTNQDVPQTVDGIDDATSITCGDVHACATREDNSVYCWGDDTRGQLGTGSTQTSPQTSAVHCVNE